MVTPEILAEYVTTTDELAAVLLKVPGLPAAVGVGQMKAAAIEVAQLSMTPDQRANWYDRHQDASAVSVVVMRETGRGAFEVVRGELPPAWLLDRLLTEVATERLRQLVDESHGSLARAEAHEPGQLAHAAVCYALSGARAATVIEAAVGEFWPWEASSFNPQTPRLDLIRAAALLLGEIERMDREEATRG